jgi:Trm5-related predicted tRNA methylase
MATEILEERILALEAEVARIKAQLRGDRYGVIGRTNPHLIEEILSKRTPDPQVDRVWEEILAEREREREEARREREADGDT